MKLTKIIVIVFVLLVFLKCVDVVEPICEKKAGYAITFDDTYIKEWGKIRSLLKKYDTKATFFISAYHTISRTDKLILDSLKLDGHQIACHSVNHINALEYLKNNTIENYLSKEIISEINLMKSDGITPTAFAYPYGLNNTKTDSALFKYFDILRDVAEVQRHIANVTRIDTIESIYFKYDKAKMIAGLGIDENFGISINEIENGFKRAIKNKEVIVFYSHKPVREITGGYQISYEYLEAVLLLAKNMELTSLTFSKLAK